MDLLLAPYQKLFLRPTRLGKRVVSAREGLIVTVTNGLHSGVGEIAPLPDGTPDQLDRLSMEVRRLWESGQQALWPWGLGCAVFPPLYAEGVERGLGCADQGFLSGTKADIQAQLHDKSEKNMHCFKLKINSVEDWALVHDLVHDLSPGGSFRLDANRGFGFDEAVEFADHLRGLPIDYVEEPLRDSSRLHEFCRVTGMPVALDETIYLGEAWVPFEGLKALVVKPNLMKYQDVFELIDRAKVLGLPLVWSSCFETEVGIGILRRMATTYSPGIPAGLDTLDVFLPTY